MARKTKAELEAERTVLVAAQQAAMVKDYPVRLMLALEKATKELNYELSVKNQLFVLFDRDTDTYFTPALTLEYSDDAQYALEDLEMDLELKAQEQNKAEARSRARAAALNKLTKEERELLDLPKY